jgi:glycosyltransferase involved in cell wall biosynthesis
LYSVLWISNVLSEVTVNILIVGDSFGFPHGTGATARVHAYAKGLQANGATVRVLCFKTSERNPNAALNTQPRGVYDGIPFEYTCEQTIRADSFWQRRWLELKGLLAGATAVLRTRQTKRIDAIIYYSPDAFLCVFSMWIMSRLVGAVFLGEKTELPFVYATPTLWVQLAKCLHERFLYKLFDGFIVISRFLEGYFAPRLRKDARLLRIPIVVDLSSFSGEPEERSSEKPIIAYCGHLNHTDEIDTLLRVFSLVASDFPKCRLRVIGGSSNPETIGRYEKLVSELRLNGRVQFTSAVPRRDIPHLLAEADVLVLPRSDKVFSRAGFPTKLAEYLAAAKPVVVTSVGDIPLYLEDGISGYLVRPGDIRAFADRVSYALAHPIEATEVGRRGRELALRCFDTTRQSRNIIELVNDLQSRPFDPKLSVRKM